MTQASTAPHSFAAAPPLHPGGETSGESTEDPDSPGPHTRSSLSAAPPSPNEHPPESGAERLNDPLAEPLAALLGTALALLTLAVPLLAVLAEGKADATGRAPASERIDHRPTPRGAAGP